MPEPLVDAEVTVLGSVEGQTLVATDEHLVYALAGSVKGGSSRLEEAFSRAGVELPPLRLVEPPDTEGLPHFEPFTGALSPEACTRRLRLTVRQLDPLAPSGYSTRERGLLISLKQGWRIGAVTREPAGEAHAAYHFPLTLKNPGASPLPTTQLRLQLCDGPERWGAEFEVPALGPDEEHAAEVVVRAPADPLTLRVSVHPTASGRTSVTLCGPKFLNTGVWPDLVSSPEHFDADDVKALRDPLAGSLWRSATPEGYQRRLARLVMVEAHVGNLERAQILLGLLPDAPLEAETAALLLRCRLFLLVHTQQTTQALALLASREAAALPAWYWNYLVRSLLRVREREAALEAAARSEENRALREHLITLEETLAQEETQLAGVSPFLLSEDSLRRLASTANAVQFWHDTAFKLFESKDSTQAIALLDQILARPGEPQVTYTHDYQGEEFSFPAKASARYLKALFLEQSGDRESADAEFRKLARQYSTEEIPDPRPAEGYNHSGPAEALALLGQLRCISDEQDAPSASECVKIMKLASELIDGHGSTFYRCGCSECSDFAAVAMYKMSRCTESMTPRQRAQHIREQLTVIDNPYLSEELLMTLIEESDSDKEELRYWLEIAELHLTNDPLNDHGDVYGTFEDTHHELAERALELVEQGPSGDWPRKQLDRLLSAIQAVCSRAKGFGEYIDGFEDICEHELVQ